MTNLEKLKNMNLEEFTEWLTKNGAIDDAPWDNWFMNKYCKNCESISKDSDKWGVQDYSYCELNKKCKYFPDNVDCFDVKHTIKLWLESEDNN